MFVESLENGAGVYNWPERWRPIELEQTGVIDKCLPPNVYT
jgi:hypothetical protein